MRGVIVLLILVSLSPAMADETTVDDPEPAGNKAYEQVLIKFNTNIKKYSSWKEFHAATFPLMSKEPVGTCFTLTGDAMKPVENTKAQFQMVDDKGWKKTSGNGWRKLNKDRTFVELRVNQKSKVLVRVEGVKPRFFFAHTKRICEFPLLAKERTP